MKSGGSELNNCVFILHLLFLNIWFRLIVQFNFYLEFIVQFQNLKRGFENYVEQGLLSSYLQRVLPNLWGSILMFLLVL